MKTFTIIAFILSLFIHVGCSASSGEQFTIPELKARSAVLAGKDFERNSRSFQELKTKFAKDTTDLTSLVKIAQIFVLEARTTGDHQYYYPAATKLVDRVLRRDPNNFEALVTKGTVLMSYHRFREALAVAERAQSLSKGGNAFVLGILVDANVEVGNYEDAVKYCDQMLALRPDLRSYSRAAYIRELHGDNEGAKRAMKMAAESGMFGEEDRAWAFQELAKLYVAEGAYDTALFLFNGILEERPAYAQAMSGRATIMAAKGDHRTAIAELTKAMELSPAHETAEELVALYSEMGDTVNSLKMRDKVIAMFDEHERNGWNIDREYAEFCLLHGIRIPEALKRAERDQKSRIANIHAEEIYAWALAENGRAQEAVAHIETAMRLGTRDIGMLMNGVKIYHLAGMNEKALGLLSKISLYERCLDQAERAEAAELAVLVQAQMK